MSPASTSSVASTAEGLSSKGPSAMLDYYLESSMQALERLTLEPSTPTKKGKKRAVKKAIKKKVEKTVKYLDDWEEMWTNASKSDSK